MELSSMIPELLSALPLTLAIMFVALVAGFVLAIMATVLRVRRIPVLSQLADLYVSYARSVPVVLQLFVAFYGLPVVVGLFGIVPDGGAGITAGISFNCLCIFAAVLLLGRAVGLATGRKSVKLLFLVMTFFFAPLYL